MRRELIKYTREKNYDKVNDLLSKGADPTAYLSEPVLIAINNNDQKMVTLFVENGYPVNANNSIAHSEAIKSQNVEILKYLISKGIPSMSILGTATKIDNQEINEILNMCFKNNVLK